MTVGMDPGDGRSARGSSANARIVRHMLDALRYDIDLTRLSGIDQADRWPDVLLVELRFHLAGLLNAMELAIGLHLADSHVEGLIGELGPGYCRTTIETVPELLSPDQLAYLRRRAVCAMLLRRAAASGVPAALTAQSDELTILALAERRWLAPLLLDAPMRPDVPAEQYHDLAWTVAALLVHGCERRTGTREPRVIPALSQATERLVARYDEGQGIQALAQRSARSIPAGSRYALAGAALVEGRLLLFAALAEVETGLPLERIVDIMADGPELGRYALMRQMRIEDAVAFRVAELMAPLIVGSGGDDALARFLEAYRAVEPSQARDWLLRAAGPAALADKLAMLEQSR